LETEVVGRPLGEILGEPLDIEEGKTGLPPDFLEARERLLQTKSQQPVPVWFTASHLFDRDGQLKGRSIEHCSRAVRIC
jgi:hypothetical protein